jgi:hypothetical protein
VSAYLKRRVTVRIEGECISSCTLVTALPRERICVGPNAAFEFHQAFLLNRFDPEDTSIRSDDGTALMMRFYPKRVRAWIAAMGGLTKDLITLKGVRRLFRTCE